MEEYTEEEDNKPILYEYILEICKSKEAQLPNVNINIIKNLLESTELPFVIPTPTFFCIFPEKAIILFPLY
jgi:hypothetical protein